MPNNAESENIEQLLVEAAELIQQINSDYIKIIRPEPMTPSNAPVARSSQAKISQ
jgi:hypothetical protein